MTGRAQCQRQVAFFKIIVELQLFECNMHYLFTKMQLDVDVSPPSFSFKRGLLGIGIVLFAGS